MECHLIEFPKYAKIKDHYCVCYFGHSDEYLVQLRLLKPIVERKYPGLQLFFGCKDDKTDLLKPCENILKISELRLRRYDFAHIKELKYDNKIHPVEEFLTNTGLADYFVDESLEPIVTTKCVIITEGTYPTKPLEKRQIEQIKRMVADQGFQPEINTSIQNSGLVVGVESVGLFEAAGLGIATTLIPTGVGTRLYKNMFSKSSIMDI